MESAERKEADGCRGGDGRRRRRPPHLRSRRRAASLSCLLLAPASPALALAADDAAGGAGADGPPSLRRTSRSRRLNAKYCPGKYKGKAPTKRCAGYLTCDEGEAVSSIFPCAGGTMFDVRTGTCTWPDGVDCKVGEELLAQVGKDKDKNGKGKGSDDGGGESEDEEPSKFCPARYTGRAPTKNCGGYVQCNDGREGISAKCPPDAKFNSATSLCEYDLRGCAMLVGDSPALADYVGANELDRFCPADYNGRAPTYDCEGYVDCRGGKARRSKNCPGSTKFDVMVMTCTYSLTSSGCDALEPPAPTPSPEGSGGSGDDGEVVGCPEGHTGYLALPGCEEYIYCALGAELSRFKCSAGTLFFASGGYCNWAEQVSCDTTKRPSEGPTYKPTYEPTTTPTGAPVEFDLLGDVYYPDFSDGSCLNDGRFPPGVGRQYLFADAGSCCDRYFPSNRANCLRATMPSPAPTPTEGRQWYPDYEEGICRNDGDAGEWESNFFFTYEECCAFEWIPDEVACLRAAPVVAYYPDYDTNECRNDGMQSPYESNVFGSLEECCRFDWIDYGLCITGGSGRGNGNDNGNSPQQMMNDAGSGEPEVLYEFYPDYEKDVCHCDGKQSDFEINIFSSYDSCCQFSLIDTGRCRQYEVFQSEKCVEVMPPGQVKTNKPAPAPSKPSKPPPDPVWYPDTEGGFCRDDGREPRGVLLTVSYQVCCKRFFNLDTQECQERSSAVSVTTTGPDNPCPGLRSEKKCVRDGRCRWDEGDRRCFPATTPGPTRTPTPKPQKPDKKPDKKTDKKPNKKPNKKPTRRPVPAPPPPEGKDSPCGAMRRKQCLKAASQCVYDAPAGLCRPVPTAAPVRPPANPYYPDYFLNVCRNDGGQDAYAADDELYDDHEACCKNKWLNFKTCTKHAKGKKTLEQLSAAGEDGYRADGDGSRTPYYPDYFFNVCRNDGRQPDLEKNLFDTLEECCNKVEYIDYESCMSHDGS